MRVLWCFSSSTLACLHARECACACVCVCETHPHLFLFLLFLLPSVFPIHPEWLVVGALSCGSRRGELLTRCAAGDRTTTTTASTKPPVRCEDLFDGQVDRHPLAFLSGATPLLFSRCIIHVPHSPSSWPSLSILSWRRCCFFLLFASPLGLVASSACRGLDGRGCVSYACPLALLFSLPALLSPLASPSLWLPLSFSRAITGPSCQVEERCSSAGRICTPLCALAFALQATLSVCLAEGLAGLSSCLLMCRVVFFLPSSPPIVQPSRCPASGSSARIGKSNSSFFSFPILPWPSCFTTSPLGAPLNLHEAQNSPKTRRV